MTANMRSFACSCLMVFVAGVCVHVYAATPSTDDVVRSELTHKVVEHFHHLDASLVALAHKADGHVLACQDKNELLERVDFLRNLIAQVVFCVERPADKKSLQFLCALSATMLECIEWLSQGGDVGQEGDIVGATLNLDKIKVDAFPEDLMGLEQQLAVNAQRCAELRATIDALNVGFFTRFVRGTRQVLSVIASYTIQSKVFAGIGIGVIGLYLFAKMKAKENASRDEGTYALSARNKINKKEVTGENLYNLTSRPSMILRLKLRMWLHENDAAWRALVQQPGRVDELAKKQVAIAQVLQEQRIKNESKYNIGFLFPADPAWRMKISGPVNRVSLQVANQDKPYGHVEMIDPLKVVPTYQTASRCFGALKLAEAIKTYKLDELEPVEAHLWSPENKSFDECCVVLEKNMQHLKLLSEYSEEELQSMLTEKKIGQILLAAKHVGLWNLTQDNIGINLDTGKIVLFDLEQPNTTKQTQQFNKDKDRYLHNVNSGVQSFYQALPVGSAVRDHVEAWARRDSEVDGAPNAKELHELFARNKKAKEAGKKAQEGGLKQAKKNERDESYKLRGAAQVSAHKKKPSGDI